MADTVGKLIREARTKAGLTQEQLARKVGGGMTAAQISRAERGEDALTQEQLKKIAKATGVTQTSLLSAARESNPDKKKTDKSAAAKAAKTTAKSTAAISSMKVTAAEKKLVEAYRKADADTRKAALRVLQGECGELMTRLLGKSDNVADDLADHLGDLIGGLFGGK